MCACTAHTCARAHTHTHTHTRTHTHTHARARVCTPTHPPPLVHARAHIHTHRLRASIIRPLRSIHHIDRRVQQGCSGSSLRDTTASSVSTETKPPGCYFFFGCTLKMNTAGSTASCSSSSECLCKTLAPATTLAPTTTLAPMGPYAPVPMTRSPAASPTTVTDAPTTAGSQAMCKHIHASARMRACARTAHACLQATSFDRPATVQHTSHRSTSATRPQRLCR